MGGGGDGNKEWMDDTVGKKWGRGEDYVFGTSAGLP